MCPWHNWATQRKMPYKRSRISLRIISLLLHQLAAQRQYHQHEVLLPRRHCPRRGHLCCWRWVRDPAGKCLSLASRQVQCISDICGRRISNQISFVVNFWWTKLLEIYPACSVRTEREIKVFTWLREISSCSSLSALNGSAWVLLSKTYKSLFPPLYCVAACSQDLLNHHFGETNRNDETHFRKWSTWAMNAGTTATAKLISRIWEYFN